MFVIVDVQAIICRQSYFWTTAFYTPSFFDLVVIGTEQSTRELQKIHIVLLIYIQQLYLKNFITFHAALSHVIEGSWG